MTLGIPDMFDPLTNQKVDCPPCVDLVCYHNNMDPPCLAVAMCLLYGESSKILLPSTRCPDLASGDRGQKVHLVRRKFGNT